MDQLTALVYADGRDWTVTFEKRGVGPRDEALPYMAISRSGEDRRATWWSLQNDLCLAHEIDREGALRGYLRLHRQLMDDIEAEAFEGRMLDFDGWEQLQKPTSGRPVDLVAWELAEVLWHLNLVAFNGVDRSYPPARQWDEQRVHLEPHPAFDDLKRFYDDYAPLRFGTADSGTLRRAIQRGNLAALAVAPRVADVGSNSPAEPTARPRRAFRPKSWRDCYKLDDVPLGSGGQAEVFRATDKATGAALALKRVNHNDAEAVMRLRREIEAQQGIKHRHVMPVVRASEHHDWYSMPLADRTLLTEALPLHQELLREIVICCAKALIAGHNVGHLHRDVSPANVFHIEHEADARWVLGDWGLVRRVGMTTMPGTKAGGQFGTLGFAAPETSRDAHGVDARADIYSLGRVVAWAVTGTSPEQNLPLPVTGPWEYFVAAATQHAPDSRPRSVEELLTYVPASDVGTKAPASTARAGRVELTYQKDRQRSDGRVHWYELEVWVTNTGTRPIHEWHVDLRLPRVLLKPNAGYSLLVEEQSDRETAVLRATEKTAGGSLYPDDRKCAMKVVYRMDDDLFEQSDVLLSKPVTATAFLDGDKAEERKVVRELQAF